MVLSATHDSNAGFCNAMARSSSIMDMFSPPKAAACEETGNFRKLKVLFTCAFAPIIYIKAQRTVVNVLFINSDKIVAKYTAISDKLIEMAGIKSGCWVVYCN